MSVNSQQWLTEYFGLSDCIRINNSPTHKEALPCLPKSVDKKDDHLTSESKKWGYFDHIKQYLIHSYLNIPFLRSIMLKIQRDEITSYISESSHEVIARKIGFWYEFLTEKDIPVNMNTIFEYSDLLDSEIYITGTSEKVPKWFIKNNLLGDARYCPVVRNTSELKNLLDKKLIQKSESLACHYPVGNQVRASNYFFSGRTTFPGSPTKTENINLLTRHRKFQTLLQLAGSDNISCILEKERLLRLQNQIVDPEVVADEFRSIPIQVDSSSSKTLYICPPPSMLQSLMAGLNNVVTKISQVPTEIQAGIISFGFVFIHPFVDGNGRIARFLVHDVINRHSKVLKDSRMLITANLYKDKKGYLKVMQNYCKPITDKINHKCIREDCLEIANPDEVEDYYKYPDLTLQCTFLLKSLYSSITKDIPHEMLFLEKYDKVKRIAPELSEELCVKVVNVLLSENPGIIATITGVFARLILNLIELFNRSK